MATTTLDIILGVPVIIGGVWFLVSYFRKLFKDEQHSKQSDMDD